MYILPETVSDGLLGLLPASWLKVPHSPPSEHLSLVHVNSHGDDPESLDLHLKFAMYQLYDLCASISSSINWKC